MNSCIFPNTSADDKVLVIHIRIRLFKPLLSGPSLQTIDHPCENTIIRHITHLLCNEKSQCKHHGRKYPPLYKNHASIRRCNQNCLSRYHLNTSNCLISKETVF